MSRILKVAEKNKPSVISLITVAVVTSLITALCVLIFVLPVYYGVDPFGQAAKLSSSGQTLTEVASVPETAAGKIIPQPDELLKAGQNQATQPAGSAIDALDTVPEERQAVFTLTVPPKQNRSFQIYMERDYDLDYHWATDGKPLYAELRGENPQAKGNKLKVFGKLTERKAKGFFIPPFTGNYSLYWENKTVKAITVRLTAKGTYRVLN